MGEVVFIAWRESVEALLVVGILHAWLRERPDRAWGLRWLWAGVALCLAAAVGLALLMLGASSLLDGEAGEWFQAAMVLVAAALILQMVGWMRRHGRALRQDLEQQAAGQIARASGWGIALLAALAIAREGSETVIFLYGLAGRHTGSERLGFAGSALAGVALALASYGLLQSGRRWLSWRRFFQISEALLLLLAAALWINAVDRLISLDVLPTLVDPLWDSADWLDDSGAVGGLVAALTGYRARPALISVLAYVGFWGGVAGLLWSSAPGRTAVRRTEGVR
jgi:high-affinity iron transporter